VWIAPTLAPAQEGVARAVGATYRRPLGNDPATLDPARISDVYSRSVAQQIFDGLVQFDQTLTITPGLAKFWKASRDGLRRSFAPFVSILAMGHAKILPRDLVEQRGEAFATQPVGTGPFKFVQWERGKSVVLAANPDYFDGPPQLARLVYRIFPGEASVAMFE